MWAGTDLRPVEKDGQAFGVTASASCLHAAAAASMGGRGFREGG